MRDPRSAGPMWTIFFYELKMLLRDTRTLLITVAAPLILFPAWIFLANRVERTEERRLDEAEYRYTVEGPHAEWAGGLMRRALALEPKDEEGPTRFLEVREVEDPDSALATGAVHLLVKGVEPDSGVVREVRLEFRADNDFSRRAAQRAETRLRRARALDRDAAYRARGFPVALDSVAPVESVNVASAEKEAGAFLGLALTPFLLLLMLTGGSIVAADALSGEKERGTLETLLTTAASRREIVRAKQLAVIVVGLAVAVVNVANLSAYLWLGVLDLPASLQVSIGPVELGLLLILFVPLAVLVSGALLLLSGVSTSYREYQIYFFPVFLVFLVPSLAAMLPGIELRSAIALVPVSGIGVAVREIMVGDVDWLFVGLAFASSAAAAAWITVLTERTLSNERLVAGKGLEEADLLGGAALFPRHVLRWFLGFWVLFFVVSLWFGESLGIRGQILVNVVGIFFGGSVFLLRRYRLPVREALSLHRPHPAAWVATLIGAPSALILGVGLAELVNTWVFPVPREILEAFGEMMSAPDLPLWQMVLFLAVLPGIFEELAFRGVLLHGVRKRMGKWASVLLVGAIFGFFHVSLFRIVPTAWLGMILTGVVLLSGSILPAILWHALNNAVAVVPVTLGWIPETFIPPMWASPVAAVGLGLSFWILWRTRPRTRQWVRGDPTHEDGPPPAGPDTRERP